MTSVRARRAFTLLELLIVVGVLVALSAIVLPYGSQILESQSFEREVDDTMSQVISARAWAQREGGVVELVITADGSQIEARMVDLLREAEDEGDGASSADGMESALRGSKKAQRLKAQMERRVADVAARTGVQAETAGGVSQDGGFQEVIREPWALHRLEGGAAASVDAPVAIDVRQEFASSGADDRIALFLPDGSAAAVRSLWISAGSRIAQINIDPLLGEVRRNDSAAPRLSQKGAAQ